MAGGLELHDLKGPFQPKPFYDSMKWRTDILRQVILSGSVLANDSGALKGNKNNLRLCSQLSLSSLLLSLIVVKSYYLGQRKKRA